MKKLSRLLLVLTLVLLIGCTSVLLVACDDKEDQGGTPTTPSFRVSFIKNYPNTDEDVAFTNVTVKQGKTVSAYEITEDDRLAGHDFDGWYVGKEEGAEKFDFATKITQNTKIYAHWKENGKSTDASLSDTVFTPEKVSVTLKDEGTKDVETGVYRYITGTAGNVLNHDNSVFDFTMVLTKLRNANAKPTYSVWADEECALTINNDKNNLVVNLKNGNNIYYIKAVAEDTKVYKVYKVNVYLEPIYNVTFEKIKGRQDSVSIKQYKKGELATEPTNVDNAGFRFNGWYYLSEEERDADGDIVDVNGDKLVKVDGKYYFADKNGERMFAYVDENGRNVVYFNGEYYLTDKTGARTTDKAEVKYNKLDENGYPVYAEGTPTKVNAFTEYKWDFAKNKVDREGIRIYGKWTKEQFKITLRLPDGAEFAGTTEKERVIENISHGATGSYIASQINDKLGNKNPTKPHAKFVGWYYTDPTLGEIEVIDSQGYGKHNFDFGKDIVLLAKFEADTYKIVVSANDPAMAQDVVGSNDKAPYDKKVTISATAKTGYVLKGWLLNGEKYDAVGTNSNFEYTIDEKHVQKGAITFTAVFEEKLVKITFESDVDSAKYNNTYDVKFNSAVLLGTNVPDVTKLSDDETKRFIGWYYFEKDGTKTYVVKYNYDKNENEVLIEKWTFTEDKTLTAEWIPYEFNVTIYEAEYTLLPDMGGLDITAGSTGWGEWDSALLEQAGYILKGYTKAFSNGSTVSITATVNTPNHYMFVGWKQLEADGNLKDVTTDANLSVTVHEKDVTYVAFWSYKPVTVTFESGDPSVTAPEKTEVPFGKELELALPQGAPDEKTFDGWWNGDFQYTGADGKSFENRTFKDVMLIENGITLTAKWKNINYFFIEDGVIKGIDAEKAKKGDTYKDTFTIDFDDDVFEIADGAFKNNKFIKNITIKGNIKRIGKEAFANSNITSVTFEGNFKGLVIDEGAFRDCVGIKEIMLPDNVEELEANIFEGCYSLEKLAYSANVPLGVLFTTSNPNNNTYWYSAQQDGVVYYLPTALKEVIVTNTVSTIADYAFQNATQLTKVTLATAKEDKPYTIGIGNYSFANTKGGEGNVFVVDLQFVKTVGNNAFKNSNIKDVNFKSLEKMSDASFSGSGVVNVSFENAPIDYVPGWAFAGCANLVSVNLKGIKVVYASAFANSGLQSVSNATTVESIGSKAFFKAQINSADAFRNVTDIDEEAFHNTTFFENATGVVKIGKVLYAYKGTAGLPDTDTEIVSIAPNAFKNATINTVNLTNYTSLKSIERKAFAGSNISTVKLPASLMIIKDSAFRGSKVQSVDFSACENLTSIWQYAFADCKLLNELIFKQYEKVTKDTLTLSINAYAFNGCVALTSVKLPENLKELGAYAFAGCINIETIEFITNAKLEEKEAVEGGGSNPKYEKDNLITAIGDGAFMGCNKLKSVSLPYIVASIGNYAFKGCVELTSFTTMEGIEGDKQSAKLSYIGNEAFFGCVKLSNVENRTTKGVSTLGNSAFEKCIALVTIDLSGVRAFNEGVFRNATALKNVTMNTSASITVGREAFMNCTEIGDITAKLAGVEDGAFRNCVNLRAIEFAPGIKSIGAHAFNGCVLVQKVVIPASVVTIGDSAFNGCRGIATLTFETGSKLMSIGYSAFGGCSLLTSVKLPASLTVLNSSAFYGCSDLAFVEIGENIERIGEDAFAYCNDEIIVKFIGTTVPEFGGNIFEGLNNAKLSVRQGYKATFEAVLGNQYTIDEYTA